MSRMTALERTVPSPAPPPTSCLTSQPHLTESLKHTVAFNAFMPLSWQTVEAWTTLPRCLLALGNVFQVSSLPQGKPFLPTPPTPNCVDVPPQGSQHLTHGHFGKVPTSDAGRQAMFTNTPPLLQHHSAGTQSWLQHGQSHGQLVLPLHLGTVPGNQELKGHFQGYLGSQLL